MLLSTPGLNTHQLTHQQSLSRTFATSRRQLLRQDISTRSNTQRPSSRRHGMTLTHTTLTSHNLNNRRNQTLLNRRRRTTNITIRPVSRLRHITQLRLTRLLSHARRSTTTTITHRSAQLIRHSRPPILIRSPPNRHTRHPIHNSQHHLPLNRPRQQSPRTFTHHSPVVNLYPPTISTRLTNPRRTMSIQLQRPLRRTSRRIIRPLTNAILKRLSSPSPNDLSHQHPSQQHRLQHKFHTTNLTQNNH